MINIGLDAGSTTVKIVAVNEEGNIIFKEYRRHFADINATVVALFGLLQDKTGNVPARLSVTGSAGMGIAERAGMPFVQEVVAACELIMKNFPKIKTLVDIGGEDAKMIFFRDGKSPDIRMNGNCAGGTGSFIDQMSTILNVEVGELSGLAAKAKTIYPIASRCGVFSKTDVQNLLARNVRREDIAASIFHAVSMQVITSLARGYDMESQVFICGGPFSFIPALREAFIKQSGLKEDDFYLSEYAEVIPAWGAAINASGQVEIQTKLLSEYIDRIRKADGKKFIPVNSRLQPLFKTKEDYEAWAEEKEKYKLPHAAIENLSGEGCFIGIDSGSTTTKIIAIDAGGRVFFHFYDKNKGNSLKTATAGLAQLYESVRSAGKDLTVLGSCVTGYGEDLIKKAFSLNGGMVETIAHYTAAYRFDPAVSFILDIGGQDMKATFIENGTIKRLEINEACSSGCGSFIETFARSLNYTPQEFSKIAFLSKQPCDLGTRCTVFMNSKVKQSLREGAAVADISAGLGYSVVKNCLNKVLKLKDTSELGDHIMVQGGTFRNLAVIRSLENELGKRVMVTDYPELMGAYGAALFARENAEKDLNAPVSLRELVRPQEYTDKITVCKGCENQCTVTRFRFENGNQYFSGNKCEKVYTNLGENTEKGQNLYEEKYNLLFDRIHSEESKSPDWQEAPKMRLGIPRALGIYEDFPFWHALFTECGVEVVLSEPSTMKLYEKGIATVMADNICFPAKLANGHVFNLIDKQVDRIFLPFVVHEDKENSRTANSYNCPVVTGYSEVIRSAIDPAGRYGIPFDSPTFSFKDRKLMKKACSDYLRSILPDSVTKEIIERAFSKGLEVQRKYERTMNERCKSVLRRAAERKGLVVLLAGRPYHSDPLIQHKIAGVIAGFGVDVITEDVVRNAEPALEDVQSIMQWAYTNRILTSALWAAKAPANVHYIELTSFGCGPDAFIIDEVADIMRRNGKNATFLKIDDINNIGSTRLRIRSLIESLKFRHEKEMLKDTKPVHTKPYLDEDRRRRTILMPWFADFYSPFLPALFGLLGYRAENLPPSDMQSAEYGLKYSNNEICYPATLVVGDFMKALDSGKYKRNEVALAITQTGGQCRATNYVTLLKKAMIAAGFEDIPVITVSTAAGTINEQPGFKIKWRKIIRPVIACMAYADCLSQMYYATAPREIIKGTALRLKEKYIRLGIEALERAETKAFYALAGQAAEEFRRANNGRRIPRIGIVGEIFVKYNNFGHGNIVNWLIEQGVEPVVPALSDFFTVYFANRAAKEEGYIEEYTQATKPLIKLMEKFAFGMIHKMEDRAAAFPYINRVESPHAAAAHASEIINLNAQFGEGWRISSEFVHFVRMGVNNVVSLQPFGCIANQVISKGIEKRVKELYPSLNLLFLDFDSNMAEANVFNRLHFMIRNAREEIKHQTIVSNSR